MIENWMYAPGRLKWVTRPEKTGRACVFCQIARGDHKVESLVLHKGKRFMVIMNLYPYTTGHVQVLPIRHVEALEKLTDKEVSEMLILVKKSMKVIKKVLNPVGFNVGLNQGGSASGASINHLHVHVVPRFKTDFGFIDTIGATRVLPERVEDTYKRLKKHEKMME
ncbi:MAG: HIT domain-containing protein [Candidatus Aenigmatarchaeota archaeon]|nr:MAG: HIT domain-containing protein [Candidatus Aenigmarchaeota archaeon]